MRRARLRIARDGVRTGQDRRRIVTDRAGRVARHSRTNTIALLPKTVGGQTVEYIVLDDASDTTQAVQNTKKLISENKVDAIIGSTTTPNSLAMIDVVAEGETPMISLASSARIIEPVDAKTAWVFKTPQTDAMMASAIAEHASTHGVKTIALHRLQPTRSARRSTPRSRSSRSCTTSRWSRTSASIARDTSVTGQVLKILAANPDAVVIGAAGHAGRVAAEDAASSAATRA